MDEHARLELEALAKLKSPMWGRQLGQKRDLGKT